MLDTDWPGWPSVYRNETRFESARLLKKLYLMDGMVQHNNPPLAILGMACCLPGAPNLTDYWKLLIEGRSALGPVPEQRLNRELYYDQRKGRIAKTYIDTAGTIDYPAFDPALCNYPSRLIPYADVGHLLMCQVAAESCRHGGLDPFGLQGSNVGVYIGNNSSGSLATELSYAALAEEAAESLHEVEQFQDLTGSDAQEVISQLVENVRRKRPRFSADGPLNVAFHVTANAVSESLGLTGPSMVLDAACSSSLKALAMAARDLWLGATDMAIVGGASYCSSDGLLIFSSAQAGSEKKQSCPFSDNADGLVSAEGYAAIVVKTLDRALADGDPIQAVVNGIGISSDGKGKSLWAPRKEGQVKAVERAYGGGAEMSRIAYIEGHATSTALGDQTELDSMATAFGTPRRGLAKAPFGGVKANIGHVLEPSGLAGLIKTALILQKGIVPKQINCLPLNSKVDWKASPFYVPTENEALAPSPDGQPRQAAVNAFGIGGLNAHVVLQEYLEQPVTPSTIAKPSKPAAIANEPIAIIGIGCLYPGARTWQAFADLVFSGEDPKIDLPKDRWNAGAGYSAGDLSPWRSPTKRGGFLTDFEYDWRRHRIAPKVLTTANPLQFMVLDCCDAALADAGYDKKPFDNENTAVMVGSRFESDFSSQLAVGFRLPDLQHELTQVLQDHGYSDGDSFQALLEAFSGKVLEHMPALIDDSGSFTPSSLCSRLTKTYDLMGGAGTIDSGNTVALAAIAQATAALRTNSCSMMLCAVGSRAMGLTTYLRMGYEGDLAAGEALSTLDRKAKGQLPGEGAGLLVLKRLSDAQRDGDPIRGVIHGIGAGFSAQPQEAFSQAIERAWQQSRVSKEDVQLVELSASPAGVLDKELAAISTAYGNRKSDVPLRVGAAAAQFGNSLGASGLTSLLKANAQLERLSLPSQFGLNDPRELVSHEKQGLSIALGETSLTSNKKAPVLAGVSSWDTCGSAYHLILQRGSAVESPKKEATVVTEQNAWQEECKPWKTIRLEAGSLEELQTVAKVAAEQPFELFGRTGNQPFRTAGSHRLAIIADSAESLAERLQIFLKHSPAGRLDLMARKQVFYSPREAKRGKVAFLFSGQGSQYDGMLRSLVTNYAPAARIVRKLDETLQSLGYPTCSDLAWERGDQLGKDVFRTQLSLLVADTILHRSLATLGVRADLVAGHSFGEFPALLASGAWSFASAAQATKVRCDSIESCQQISGGMLSTNAGSEAAAAACLQLGGRAYVANLNAQDQTVIAGTNESLPSVQAILESEGFVARTLSVNRPFHTPIMEEVKQPLRAGLQTITTGEPTLPMLSSVTNEYVHTSSEIIENLVEQMTRPVAYTELVSRLLREGTTALVECGPKGVLTGLHKKHEATDDRLCIASDDSKQNGLAMLMSVRASLEVRGYFDSEALDKTKTRKEASVRVPTENGLSVSMIAWGREHREGIRSLLRQHIDSKPQKEVSPGNTEPENIEQIRAIALGAGVGWPAVADYCRHNPSEGSLCEIIEAAISKTARPIEVNPRIDTNAFQTITAKEFYEKCGTQYEEQPPEFADHASCRFSPKVLESPLGPVDLSNLRFNGRVLIVGENETAKELSRLITAHGGKPVMLSTSLGKDEALQQLQQHWEESPLPHLYLMTACDEEATTSTEATAWSQRQEQGMMLPFLISSRWFQLLTDSKLVKKGSAHGVTLLGGDFGFSGQARGVEGGAIAAIVKSLIHEAAVPTNFVFQTTLVDFSGEQSSEQRAELLLSEVVNRSPYELEVGYAEGRRYLMRPVPTIAKPSKTVATPSGTWVITGGGRGITALVALELAKRFGIRLHLLGSSPAPSVPSNLQGLGEQELKTEVMRQAKATGESPAKKWRSVSRMLELDSTLQEMKAAGVQATYHECDVSDHDMLARTLESIRQSDGPITGLLHGAGIEISTRLQAKNPETVRKTLAIKAQAASALIELTSNDPLKHFVGFGSIAGRVGSPGQADYAMANEVMAKLLAWQQVQRPECVFACFDWGPWAEIGMAMRPENRAAMSLLTGVPPHEGVEHFLNELTADERTVENLFIGWDLYNIFYTERTPEAQTVPEDSPTIPEPAPIAAPMASPPTEPISDGTIRRYVMRWTEAPSVTPVLPVKGRALVVGDNADATALARLLRQQGTPVAHYKNLLHDENDEEAKSIIQRCWKETPITHLFFCTARDSDANQIDNQEVWQQRTRTGLISPYRLISEWLKKASVEKTLGESVLACVTSLGGDCGFESGPDAIEGAGLSGILKAVHAEHGGPSRDGLRVKVIDAPADEEPQSLATAVLSEATGDCQEVEVAYVHGQRRLPRLVHENSTDLPRNPPQPGTTWIVTGGARGITAEVVRGLGRKYGLKLHLLGTRPLPQLEESVRYLSDEELKPYKRQIVRKAIKEGQKPEDAWGPVRRDFEIDRNLRSMTAEGINVTYHECDVTNPRRLAEVVKEVRQQSGPISGIIHGAGIQGIPVNVRDMLESSVEIARKTLAVKCRAMLDLLELTKDDPLEHCIGFGSISGRFGSNSASFYCAGTDMLCKIMDRVRRLRPRCRAIGFHWHGWSDVGMIMRPEGLGTAKIFKLELLSPKEGVEYLINELEAGAPEGEVVVTNPTYIELYHPRTIISAADAVLPTTPKQAVPSANKSRNNAKQAERPLVCRLNQSKDTPQTVVGEIELDPLQDPFLTDHRFQGRPLFPAVMALEGFAETAEGGSPGKVVTAVHDLQLHSGLRINTNRPPAAKIRAERTQELVKCQLVADFCNRKGEVVDPERLYSSAVVELADERCSLAQEISFEPCKAEWHDVWYPEESNLMYHGPVFQSLKRCAFSENGEAWGEVMAASIENIAGHRSTQGWHLHPALLDAALYLCGIAVWISNSHAVAIPKSLDCLRLARLPKQNEKCLVHLKTKQADEREWTFDIACYGEDRTPLFIASDYRCQNVMKPVEKSNS